MQKWLIVFSISLVSMAVFGWQPLELKSIDTQLQTTCPNPFEGTNPLYNLAFWTQTDFCKHSIPYNEIVSGGPPPDGIPPLDKPNFESIKDASAWLHDQSPVVALEINGEAKAYPLAILIWHEIANDVIGDTPVAVTFCPLCNSSIVFDRRVDGQVLRFGTTGNLHNSDLIMWDDVTQSWWQQFTGQGIVGAYNETKLIMLPSQVVGFAEYAVQYPDGKVLSRETDFTRGYGENPYINYDSSTTPFLFSGEVDKRLPATERVLAALIGGKAVAYPFSVLSFQKVINDRIGEEDVVAIWQPGARSALDQTQIDASRDVGMAALYSRRLNNQVLTFTADTEGLIRDDQTKSIWNIFGTAVDGELKGSQLEPRFGVPNFWFAWAAFHPETSIYGLAAK